MNAQELRIGNIVFDTEMGQIDTITAIEESRVSLKNAKLHYTPIKVIEAVELTPDWFERLGFEKKIVDDVYWFEWGAFVSSDSLHSFKEWKVGIWWQGDYVDDLEFEKVSTVHDLQNLFFALTAKELILKPEKESA